MPQLDPTNPFDDPQADDTVDIDGEKCPGICTLSGFKRPATWEVKKGKGTKGGTATLSELPPAKGSITFKLWTRAHFEAWNSSFRARLKYDPTKKTKTAVSIYHSSLDEIDLHAVVTENIGAREPQGGGMYHIVVEFLEYLPPSPKTITTTPNGSSSSGTGKAGASGKSDDPIADAQQAEIARLLKLAQDPGKP